MPDALVVLANDHREVLELLSRLTGGGDAAGSPRQLKALAEQLAIAESKHEAIEELCFWPVVRERLEHGEDLARQAIEQESSAKEMIRELDHATAGDGEFTTLVERLQGAVRDHITFEERQVWPKVRLALSQAELDELGEQLEAARRTAPTRPHPKTPPDPRILGAIGPAVGTMDRTRDILTGRGHGNQGLGRWRMVAAGLGVAVPAAVGLTWVLLRAGQDDDDGDRHRANRHGDNRHRRNGHGGNGHGGNGRGGNGHGGNGRGAPLVLAGKAVAGAKIARGLVSSPLLRRAGGKVARRAGTAAMRGAAEVVPVEAAARRAGAAAVRGASDLVGADEVVDLLRGAADHVRRAGELVSGDEVAGLVRGVGSQLRRVGPAQRD